ncbi:MAG TPA: hypothetical protein VFX61_21300 [Micromonosporaceae bacterium]|nr:hypothetical protein [Micromonosporaceae bacterium]
MPTAWFPLVLFPPIGFLVLTSALRSRGAVAGPFRLAAVRAALVTGAYAVLTVELLGVLGSLTAPAIGLAWVVFLAAAGTWAWRRRRSTTDATGLTPLTAARETATGFWRTASRGERLAAGTIGGLLLLELLVALLAEPNNFDSQTYHLPRVERWAAQGDLAFWPTVIHRQVTIPPGAEYLLLHLRLLTGGDLLYNLVQWAAGVGCLLIVSRIVAQLGGSRRAQLLAAFVLATTPMVTLQATSTQTDLVVAAWVACVATLALDGLTRRATPGAVLALGVGTGLTAVTKTSGLLGVGPLLVLWGIAQLRLALAGPDRRRTGALRVVGASFAVLAVALVVVGPFLARITAEFGHPLGPPRLRESIPMQQHEPGSILINALRIGHTALDTPVRPLRDAGAAAVIGLADLLGVDPQNRDITFGTTTFPVRSWYPDEDRVAFPIAGGLALTAGLLALARPGRLAPQQPGAVRGYTAAVGAALLLYCAMVKWQPWGNRLILFALVLAVPLVGLWLDAVALRRTRPADVGRSDDSGQPADSGRSAGGRRAAGPRTVVATVAAVAVLAASALAGVLAISYGFPRRLVGSGSLLTSDEWETRFLRRPQWLAEYQQAAAAVKASGARRVGLIQQNDDWEYPWWLLLRDSGTGVGANGGVNGPEIVALQSVLPSQPPAAPETVDAILCTGSQTVCQQLVPPGWHLEFGSYVGYAVAPGSERPLS